MKSKIQAGDYVRVDEFVYIVARVLSESVFCRNCDSGENCFIDFDEIEAFGPNLDSINV